MGHGSYKASDWEKLRNSKGINTLSSASDIFGQNTFSDKYDPRYISMRESCDSEDSPNSTPIILAFDVTGSMGYLAAEIGKNSLNKTATELYDKQPVSNPHIMCAAITNPDTAPGGLQVTQFEADIRVVEQLLELKVGFGGNRYSFDSLVWYFAANHTDIDSYKKRGKKGVIITIGDEICGGDQGEILTKEQIKKVFDDDVDRDLPLREVFDMASEKYEIFHIVVGFRHGFESWDKFIPGRVAVLDNVSYLSETVISILQILNGMDKDNAVGQWSSGAQEMVAKAVETIDLSRCKKSVPVPNPASAEQSAPAKKSFIAKIFGK